MKTMNALMGLTLAIASAAYCQQEYFPVATGAKWEYRVTFATAASLPYRPVVEYPEGILGSSIFCGMGTWSAGQVSFEVLVGNISEKTSSSTGWNLAPSVLMSKFLFFRTDTARDRCQLRLTNDGSGLDLSAVMLLTAVSPPWRIVRHLARLGPSDVGQLYAISVPAGQFSNCVSCTMKLYGDGIYVPTGTYPVETYLAPGVGIVKAIGKSSSNATLYTLELTRFTAGSAVSAEREHSAPTEFALDQNFPNPFNPSTTIQFDLPNKSFVSLKIFNTLGLELATLVSSDLSPGRHSITWNPSNVSSGIYYCRMQAGQFTMTKKLILLK